ncbi:hypothetical protein NNJEOMEG_01824 [Fundidesulfovibrio magnetotacticus]|uniref:SGNH hydrolase-type esterase domain-containing protein n=1 Tax=Fundidesulfovibrio magnetotacticus TaxID=2730080 RepID=A0A6V8LVZ8_9BACT|nr:SGNH/GDSL hydrolase family protein [Fundidesulfovibrio magnetotacticus]GFK93986.1 hypothetical protein NNJEOMEG_01824 [Fundidesulfovibrio magnetotacticus]
MALTIVCALAFLCLHAAVLAGPLKRRMPRLRGAILSVLLVADSLLAGVLAMEVYFRAVHDQSDGFALTWAGKAWMARHWKPVNSLGYRDAEVTPPAPGQRSVAFLGDSFVAGHGVERPEDRFTDVAARALGPGWKVYNLARNGWDSVDEAKGLRAFPVAPEAVVLVYYLNDIFNAAAKADYPLTFSVNLPRGFTKTLTENSALFDFVYWRFARGGNLAGGASTFWDSLKGAYADPKVWGAHAAELADLAQAVRERGAKPLAVVFPMLQAVDASAPLTAKVAEQLTALGFETVDLAPVLRGRPVPGLVVNALDAHPSLALHREVGEMLAAKLKAVQEGHGDR